MRGRSGLAALSVGVLLLICAPGRAEVTVRDPGTFVVDRAGVIDAGVEQQLEQLLIELQQKTTAQVKVLTVSTTEGEDFFGFVHRHAELWKLGAQGKDNGVLIALAVKERQVRIHTGYGLEALLPDSWCGTLRRMVTKEHLGKNEFGAGLGKMTVTIANRIAADANTQLTGRPGLTGYRVRSGGARHMVCGGGLVPFIAVVVILSSLSRRRRHYGRWGGGGLLEGLLWGSVLGGAMRGGRSGWGGGFGGGFGGGGFGGGGFFGGGGGFGGGGSGGSF